MTEHIAPDHPETPKTEGQTSSLEGTPLIEHEPIEATEDIGEVAVEETVDVSNPNAAGEESWAESIEFDTPRDAVWHGPAEDVHITVTGVLKTSDGEEFVRVKEGAMPLLVSDIEYIEPGSERTTLDPAVEHDDSSDFFNTPEEAIVEDTDEAAIDPVSADPLEKYLSDSGITPTQAAAIRKILSSDTVELVKLYLVNLGVEEDKLETVTGVLTPLQLYLKKLHELGMTEDKNDKAHHALVEEVGRIRLKHLTSLVGGKEEELRKLMRSHQQDLLIEELVKLGYDMEKAREIAAVPRRNKSKLIHGALKQLGLGDGLVKGIELASAKAEIPPDVVDKAERLGMPLETLVVARDAFNKAGWKETLDYLELATTHEGAREHLKGHGIEIKPVIPVESEDEKAERLRRMTLKEINEKFPEEWEAERARRVNHKRREFFGMLERFKEYLPLDDFPLPADVEVPPEESIPKDYPGAYGLWRRVVIDNYAKLLSTEGGYQEVLREFDRVGGPMITRRLGQKMIARRVLGEQRAREREMGLDRNHGVFGRGRAQYKINLRAIEESDVSSANIRRALNLFHRNNFIKDGQATPRKRLAEMIVEHKLKEIAMREGRLDLMPPHQVKTPSGLGEDSGDDEHFDEGTV